MSKRTLKTAILSGLVLPLILGVASASAGAIFFDPTPKFVSPNDVFTVDLRWDGSGPPAEYIGDFDVDILFDPGVVTHTNTVLDPQSAFDVGFFGSIEGSTIGLNPIDMFIVSFEFPFDLIFSQDGLGRSFILATLEFQAAPAPGQSALEFSGTQTFGDEFGDRISPTLTPGLICVLDGQSCPVPTPGSLPLLALGLFGFVLQRRMLAEKAI